MRFFIFFLFIGSAFSQEIKKQDLYEISNEIFKIYRPQIQEKFNLDIKLFTDTGNSSLGMVNITKEVIKIELRSELHLAEYFTKDAFAMIVCHEIGHLIGGVPAEESTYFGPTYVVSTEGQADYFATLKCMKRYLQDKDNKSYMLSKKIDKIVKKKCSRSYNKKIDRFTCMRSAQAGVEFMNLIASNSSFYDPKYPFEHSFKTPDKFILERDDVPFLGYPDDQCRLDTLLAGALCPSKPINSDMSYTSYLKGSCLNRAGGRPKCWFNRSQDLIHKESI